jgi:hypothetical protein
MAAACSSSAAASAPSFETLRLLSRSSRLTM